MNNSLEMVEAMFGAMKAGACVVPLNLSVSDDGIEFRAELPRNPNGKLLKRELRKDYWR